MRRHDPLRHRKSPWPGRWRVLLWSTPLALLTAWLLSSNASAHEAGLALGASGERVRVMQTALDDHGYDPGPIDGVFGPMTLDAVHRFQRDHGFAPSSEITGDAWEHLVDAPGIDAAAFDLWDEGPDVARLQEALIGLGYDPGPVDGILGPRTLRALDRYSTAATPDPSVTIETERRTVTPAEPSPPERAAVTGEALFPNSPWAARIGPDPAIDPHSEAIVGRITRSVVLDTYEYAHSVYWVDASTGRHHVTCAPPWGGSCPIASHMPVAVPSSVDPPPGTDASIIIIDPARRTADEFWQWDEACRCASYGWRLSLDGDGIAWDGGGSGAGVGFLAGLVLESEIAGGYIPHALSFSSDSTCPPSDYRYPARKSDGKSSGHGCIPEGARIQLDPDLDLDRLGLSPGERTIARALQEFGAFNIDAGGAGVALYFEKSPEATSGDRVGRAYEDAGIDSDYHRIDGLPWDRLRVLADWDG